MVFLGILLPRGCPALILPFPLRMPLRRRPDLVPLNAHNPELVRTAKSLSRPTGSASGPFRWKGNFMCKARWGGRRRDGSCLNPVSGGRTHFFSSGRGPPGNGQPNAFWCSNGGVCLFFPPAGDPSAKVAGGIPPAAWRGVTLAVSSYLLVFARRRPFLLGTEKHFFLDLASRSGSQKQAVLTFFQRNISTGE